MEAINNDMNDGVKKVLVVDDDIAILGLLKKYLKDVGYAVECAESGEDALALISGEPYDLVITDYVMSGMNGIELTMKIKDLNLSLPVIAISGKDIKREFFNAGADAFISKPFVLDDLKKIVQRCFAA